MTHRRRYDESGMTLIELLIAMMLSGLVISALFAGLLLVLKTTVGLQADGASAGAQDSDVIAAQLDASEGVQQISRRFTTDIENVNKRSHVTIPGALECTPPSSDPVLDGTTVPLVSLQQRDRAGKVRLVHYRYSRNLGANWAQISRYVCIGIDELDAKASTAAGQVIATALSSSAIPTVSESGSDVKSYTLALTTVTGRQYSLKATLRLDLEAPTPAPSPAPSGSASPSPGASATPSPSTSPSADPVKQALRELVLLDENRDARVDAVIATFEGAAPTEECRAGWSIAGAPSGGEFDGATIITGSDPAMKLAIKPTTPVLSTAVGATAVSFTPASGCELQPLQDRTPSDRAAPLVVAVPELAGSNGKMQKNDQLQVQFSEILQATTLPTGALTVTEQNGTASDALSIARLTAGALPLGSTGYVTADVSFPAELTNQTLDGVTVLTVKLGDCAPGSNCNAATVSKGPFTFVPAATLTDAAANQASVLGINPRPTNLEWKMF